MKRPCWSCVESTFDATFCPHCQKIQPPLDASFFGLLGFAEKLDFDLSELEAKYHERARQVHPDRFMTRSAREQELATEQAELLNRAYRTLRDPWSRTRYLLELHRVPIAPTQLPQDLAEEYFELADTLMEGGSETPLRKFRAKLMQILANQEADFHEQRRAWDARVSEEKLNSLAKFSCLLGERAYLEALHRDLVQKRSS